MNRIAKSIILAAGLLCCEFAAFSPQAHAQGGVPLWTNRYNGPANNDDFAAAIAVDTSGNVFVTGWSWSGTGGVIDSDYATVAYSNAGVPLWTNRYNGPGNSDDRAYAIAVDGSGNVFVTGRSLDSASNYDYATIKYSGAGLPLWTNRYNGTGNLEDEAAAIAVDSSGNVFVTGSSGTVAYSGAGVPLWTNCCNSGSAIAADSSGNVFVTGDSGTVAFSGAGVLLWTN